MLQGAALFQPGDAIRMEIFLCIQCEVWAEARDAYVRALTTIDAEDWSFHVGQVMIRRKYIAVSPL